MQKYLAKGLTFLFHIIAICFLVYFTQPFADWYLSAVPAHGVDLYNSVTHAMYHLNSFSLPFNSFKDFWYAGYPVMQDFPQLSYYAMVPFVAYFGGPIGVQIFAMATLVLLLIFSYFLFYELSKNNGLSVLLSLLVLLSVNIYGALTWAGSVPYFASQCLFPLGLFFGVKYLKNPQIKNLSLMILVTGIGILIHPLAIVAYLIPSLTLLIIAGGIGARYNVARILQQIFFYVAGFILISFTYTYNFFYAILIDKIPLFVFQTSKSGDVKNATTGAQDIVDFYKGQVARLYTDTDERIYYLFAIAFILFILGLLIARRRRQALYFFPLFFIAAYTALHPALNLSGIISFFKHDPYRAFWQFPIAAGMLIAFFWGFFQASLFERIKARLKIVVFIPVVSLSVLFLIVSLFIFNSSFASVIDRIDKHSDTSSAFPEVLSMKLNKEDQDDLKRKLIPSFLDPNDKNKRLYDSDATVNIWWNSLYDMPLARGYIDPPIGTTRRSGLFLLDTSIGNDVLVRDLKFPEEIAVNYAHFLTDWHGVYFYEGGHVSPASNAPPSSYLLKDDFFDKKETVTVPGAILRNETPSGRPEARMDLTQSLMYYRVNEKYTSPVVVGSNAPAIAVFTDDAGFEQVWRALAIENIHSRLLVPVYIENNIDSVSSNELAQFDAVILHNYTYSNKDKAFRMLGEYVQKGGNLFVDTDGEIADANSDSLAELFPFDKSERKELQKTWDLEETSDPLINDIDFSLFGLPVYNEKPWKFSYPTGDAVLRDNVKVILKNSGKPILMKRQYGSGKVIWSGMNILYHINQNPIAAEGKFFKNIITELVKLGDGQFTKVDVVWDSPERVHVKSNSKPKAILFKEEFYNGWSVNDKYNGSQKIYTTGPTYPGFMYVPLKKNDANKADVTFSYNGDPLYWAVTIVQIIAILFVLELIIFKGKIVGVRTHKMYHKTRKKIGSWWEKEEE